MIVRRDETCFPDDDFLAPPDSTALEELFSCSDDRIGGIVGAYEIVALIAEGGMGKVYEARRADELYEQRVAVKFVGNSLNSARLQRCFLKERQTLARLNHPSITRLIDGGTTDDGLPYLIMEYVKGVSIKQFCAAHDLNVNERLTLCRKVCEAVAFAHRNLVVHGDIKPNNILVDADGGVKLLDFGVSQMIQTQSEHRLPVSNHATAMTPAYASPEQLRGESTTIATDVFALGVLLYELLFHRAPCDADRNVLDPIQTTTDMSHELRSIVLKATNDEPERRYETVEQFSEDIRRYQHHFPVRAERDRFGYRCRKFIRRHRTQCAAAAIALCAIVSAFVVVSIGLVDAKLQRAAAVAAQADAEEGLAFFRDMLAAANPFRNGRSATIRDLIEDAERRLASDLGQRPEIHAGVSLAVGQMRVNLMDWERARPHLENALRHYRATRSPNDPMIADCLSLLGRTLTHLNHHRAINMQKEGLDIRRSVYGVEHPAVAESLANLGFALWSSDPRHRDWGEAERNYLDSIAMHDRVGTLKSSDAARAIMSLGFMYAAIGREAEAEERYLEAIDIYASLPARDDVYETTTLRCYGDLLQQQFRYEEAIKILSRCRKGVPEGFATHSIQALTIRLSELYELAGDIERAEIEYASALASECEALIDDIASFATPNVQQVCRNLQNVSLFSVRGPLYKAYAEISNHTHAGAPMIAAARIRRLSDFLSVRGEHEFAAELRDRSKTLEQSVLDI